MVFQNGVHCADMNELIERNSPSNTNKENTFMPQYAFKIWTIACLLKYVHKMETVPSFRFYQIVREWLPERKKTEPIIESCG